MCGVEHGVIIVSLFGQDWSRQGCSFSSLLFTVVVHHVMRGVVAGGRRGLQWGIHDRLEDLDFIDNISLLSQRHLGAYRKIGELRRKAARL